MIPPETPTKRAKRSLAERAVEAAERASALRRKAVEAEFRGEAFGYELSKSSAHLTKACAALGHDFSKSIGADMHEALRLVESVWTRIVDERLGAGEGVERGGGQA